jgi:hypothetical protein
MEFITSEIENLDGIANNERIWSLGSEDAGDAKMHADASALAYENARRLSAYLSKCKNK